MRKIIPYNPDLVAFAKKLRKHMTLGEIALWREIKDRIKEIEPTPSPSKEGNTPSPAKEGNTPNPSQEGKNNVQ